MVFEFTTGILLCGQVRDFLEECKFKGLDIEWREGKGLIERRWIVKGNPVHVREVADQIMKWFSIINDHPKPR